MLMAMLIVISEVYLVEKSCSRKPQESEKNWQTRLKKAREKHSKGLMDQLDNLMTIFSAEHAVQPKPGQKWKGKDKLDLYAKPCIYYQNQKENLRRFLDDARVPPSNDVVEGRIRPVAVLRKNVNCMQTERGMQAATASLSLVQTAKLNNMDVRRCSFETPQVSDVHTYRFVEF